MLIYEISGIPIPQKQTRFVRKTGRAYNPSQKDVEKIQWQIRPYAPSIPLDCAIELFMNFYLPIPKSASKKAREQMLNGVWLPDKKPDLDNLAYLVTNSFKNIVYADDSLIVDLHLAKRYSDRPRTIIKIVPIYQLQQVGGSKNAIEEG